MKEKNGRLATIITCIILIIVSLGIAFLFNRKDDNKDTNTLSDKQILLAIDATLNTLKNLNDEDNNKLNLQIGGVSTPTDISEESSKYFIANVHALAYIDYIDFLRDKNALKIGTLQYDQCLAYDESAAGPINEHTRTIYTLVTHYNKLVCVYIKVIDDYADPNEDTNIWNAYYEIEYDFNNNKLLNFDFVNYSDYEGAGYKRTEYTSYSFNLQDNKVVLLDAYLKGKQSAEYQSDLLNNKVNGEYIANYMPYYKCFKGNIKDFSDYKGFSIGTFDYNANGVDFSSLSEEQKTLTLDCISTIREHSGSCNFILDSMNFENAVLCNEISDSIEYIEKTYFDDGGRL